MCHVHKNEYQKTGKIRTKNEAIQPYSTQCYRTRLRRKGMTYTWSRRPRAQNVTLQGKKVLTIV